MDDTRYIKRLRVRIFLLEMDEYESIVLQCQKI